MRKFKNVMLFVIAMLALSGVVQGAGVNTYWHRIGEGFPNQIVVYEETYQQESSYVEIKAKIPQLIGTADEKWQAQFNLEVKTKINDFITEVVELAAVTNAEIGLRAPYSGIVEYEVKLNRGGLLSMAVIYYAYTGGAHGMTYVDYINLDLTTGNRILFTDLFNTEAELERVVGVINSKIKEEPDWFFIENFSVEMFEPNQGFYLVNGEAVVCFSLYHIAPYAAGIQEFTISTP